MACLIRDLPEPDALLNVSSEEFDGAVGAQ